MKKFFVVALAILMLLSVFPVVASAAKLGDVDGNGVVASDDARLALRAAVGLEVLTYEQKIRADVDGVEGIASADARLILRAAVGLQQLGEISDEKPVYTIEGQTPATAIPANGEYIIRYQPNDRDPERLIRIVLLKTIKGAAANKLAHDTNFCNDEDVADGLHEWQFYLFDVEYVSSSAGANDCLEASDFIYYRDFTTETGGSPGISDSATFTFLYEGYHVHDVEYYPGSNGETMIGVAVGKGIDNLLLPIPNPDGNTWIRLDETFSSDFPDPPETIKVDSPTGKTPDSPIPADGKTVITSKSSLSTSPERKIKIELTKILSGDTAKQFAHDANFCNDDDIEDGLHEWRFYYFNLEYLSSTGGANDKMKASEIIYYTYLYAADGSSCHAGTLATLTFLEKGYGVFDVYLYPGSSSKVVIGVPIRKGLGDLMLRIGNGTDKNTWVSLALDGYVYEGDSSSSAPSLPGDKPLTVEIPGALYGYNVLASYICEKGTLIDGFYIYERNNSYYDFFIAYDTTNKLITFCTEDDGGKCLITLPIDGGTAYVTGTTPPSPGDNTVAEYVGTFKVKTYTSTTKISKSSVKYSQNNALGMSYALMQVDLSPSMSVTNLFSFLKEELPEITMKDIGFEALIK